MINLLKFAKYWQQILVTIPKYNDKALSKTDEVVVFSMSLLPPDISFLYTSNPWHALTAKENSG